MNLLSNSLKLNVNEDLGTRITAFSHYFHYVGHLAGSRIERVTKEGEWIKWKSCYQAKLEKLTFKEINLNSEFFSEFYSTEQMYTPQKIEFGFCTYLGFTLKKCLAYINGLAVWLEIAWQRLA